MSHHMTMRTRTAPRGHDAPAQQHIAAAQTHDGDGGESGEDDGSEWNPETLRRVTRGRKEERRGRAGDGTRGRDSTPAVTDGPAPARALLSPAAAPTGRRGPPPPCESPSATAMQTSQGRDDDDADRDGADEGGAVRTEWMYAVATKGTRGNGTVVVVKSAKEYDHILITARPMKEDKKDEVLTEVGKILDTQRREKADCGVVMLADPWLGIVMKGYCEPKRLYGRATAIKELYEACGRGEALLFEPDDKGLVALAELAATEALRMNRVGQLTYDSKQQQRSTFDPRGQSAIARAVGACGGNARMVMASETTGAAKSTVQRTDDALAEKAAAARGGKIDRTEPDGDCFFKSMLKSGKLPINTTPGRLRAEFVAWVTENVTADEMEDTAAELGMKVDEMLRAWSTPGLLVYPQYAVKFVHNVYEINVVTTYVYWGGRTSTESTDGRCDGFHEQHWDEQSIHIVITSRSEHVDHVVRRETDVTTDAPQETAASAEPGPTEAGTQGDEEQTERTGATTASKRQRRAARDRNRRAAARAAETQMEGAPRGEDRPAETETDRPTAPTQNAEHQTRRSRSATPTSPKRRATRRRGGGAARSSQEDEARRGEEEEAGAEKEEFGFKKVFGVQLGDMTPEMKVMEEAIGIACEVKVARTLQKDAGEKVAGEFLKVLEKVVKAGTSGTDGEMEEANRELFLFGPALLAARDKNGETTMAEIVDNVKLVGRVGIVKAAKVNAMRARERKKSREKERLKKKEVAEAKEMVEQDSAEKEAWEESLKGKKKKRDAEAIVALKRMGLGRQAGHIVNAYLPNHKKVYPVDDEVIRELAERHPTEEKNVGWVDEVRRAYDVMDDGTIGTMTVDTGKIIGFFQNNWGTATGPAKMDAAVLHRLVQSETVGPRILKNLGLLMELWAKGICLKWWTTHALVGQEKKPGNGTANPRCLLPPNTLLRCATSIFTQFLIGKLKLDPDFIMSAGAAAGTEKFHASAAQTIQCGGSVAVTDKKNAFPSTRRDQVAIELLKRCPEYFNFYMARYGDVQWNVCAATRVVLVTQTGLNIADSDSPILFGMAGSAAAENVPEATGVTYTTYADDGIMGTIKKESEPARQTFMNNVSAADKKFGLEFEVKKAQLLYSAELYGGRPENLYLPQPGGTADNASDANETNETVEDGAGRRRVEPQPVAAEMVNVDTSPATCMGLSLSRHETFKYSEFKKTADMMKTKTQVIVDVLGRDYPSTALEMLHQTVIPMMTYQLRAVKPSAVTKEILEELDKVIIKADFTILAYMPNEGVDQQVKPLLDTLRLPVRDGGTGSVSLQARHEAAYIAAQEVVGPYLDRRRLRERPSETDPTKTVAQEEAERRNDFLVAHAVPVNQINARAFGQRNLTALVYKKKKAEQREAMTDRQKDHIKSCETKVSRAFLSRAIDHHVPADVFRAAVKHRYYMLRHSPQAAHTSLTCVKHVPPVVVTEENHNHLLTCYGDPRQTGFNRTVKHNMIRDAIERLVRRCGGQAQTEVTLLTKQDHIRLGHAEKQDDRMDIVAQIGNEQFFIDVAVTASTTTSANKTIQQAINDQEGVKRRRYAELMTVHPNTTFVPAVFAYTGEPSAGFLKFVKKLESGRSIKHSFARDVSLIMTYYNGICVLCNTDNKVHYKDFRGLRLW
jgi:hypothetical protein